MINKLLVFMIMVTFVLSACGESDNVKTTTTKKTKSSKRQKSTGKKVEGKLEEVAPVYEYYPEGKRDPFESPLLKFKLDMESAQLTPLQRFDVNQLALTGIIVGLNKPKAMVRAPDGKNYILSVGTFVGKNGGKVVRINNEGVSVEEVLTDFSGETRVNSILIALPKRKGV